MIEKERGHIIAMCSILGKTSIPLAGIYAATKHGVAGLMDALECDLKLFEFDFIKTTTVFPFFVETRKELVDTVKGYGIQMPTVTPQEIAKVIVQGMRKNARKIYYPSLYKLGLIEK
jgi:all-trans-retinol dehydrogenase (NAD+)